MRDDGDGPWWWVVLVAIIGAILRAAQGGWGMTLRVIAILVILIGGALLIARYG